MMQHFFRKLGLIQDFQFKDSQFPSVVHSGLQWTMSEVGAEIFGRNGPDIQNWLNTGSARLIKENLQRQIYRVQTNNTRVYIKVIRANTPRSWARELLRPTKARLEFENAIHLAVRGIATIEPLAWGRQHSLWPGVSYFISREVENSQSLSDCLENQLPQFVANEYRAIRRQLARGLGRFLAQLHNAGVIHPDLHPGNILVVIPGSRQPRFWLTDLHAIRLGKPLSWAESLENLVVFNRFFQLRSDRSDRLRFWQSYRQTRELDAWYAEYARKQISAIEHATEKSNNRFWANRIGRYRSNNRDTCRVTGTLAKGYAHRSVPADVVQNWLADPDAPFELQDTQLLKESRSTKLAIVSTTFGTNKVRVVYKRINQRSWLTAGKNLFRDSPAVRSWCLGYAVADRGIATARPLAMFQKHNRLGIATDGYVVFEFIEDADNLSACLHRLENQTNNHARQRIIRSWCASIGMLLRRLHDREVVHRDCKAANILLTGLSKNWEHARPILIDLVGAQAGKPLKQDQRLRDLIRINASFHEDKRITRSDRLRFLRSYLHRSSDWANWKTWWQQIGLGTEIKAERNRRVGRILS